ncbi:MAG: hypothetical protein WBP52_02955, partial [Terriglobales bacterium]
MAICSLRFACLVLFALAISPVRGYATDVVFIRASDASSPEQRQLELATRFYGLNLDFVTLGAKNSELALS